MRIKTRGCQCSAGPTTHSLTVLRDSSYPGAWLLTVAKLRCIHLAQKLMSNLICPQTDETVSMIPVLTRVFYTVRTTESRALKWTVFINPALIAPCLSKKSSIRSLASCRKKPAGTIRQCRSDPITWKSMKTTGVALRG